MKKYLFKYSLEFLVIVMGISVSFWLNNVKDETYKLEKEKEILTSLHLNLTEVKTSLDSRLEMLIEENNLMSKRRNKKMMEFKPKIKGKIAGILNLHATHCAKIPKIIIPASSNIVIFRILIY